MKRFVTLILLGVCASAALAEVINLKCDGKNAIGDTYSTKITFSPDQRWSEVENMGIRMTGSVTADYIDLFLAEMRIDRKTGEFTKGKGEKMFRGKCEKNETKF